MNMLEDDKSSTCIKKSPSFWAIKMRKKEFWQTDLERFRIFDLALLYVLNINGCVFGRAEMCFQRLYGSPFFCFTRTYAIIIFLFYFFCVSHLGNLAIDTRFLVAIVFDEVKLLPQWATVTTVSQHRNELYQIGNENLMHAYKINNKSQINEIKRITPI